jgi:pimeloyl-ACP methyl ester carboxylesterase
MANDISDIIAKVFQDSLPPQILLLGHSMGGAIAGIF